MRVFVQGDTVWKICLENGTTLDAFRAVNPEIRNLDYIKVSLSFYRGPWKGVPTEFMNSQI